ncbi:MULTISPECIES: rhodanese-like domain-containing protein [Streptosporangium]|uniref:rhodanese-like domain-containing protein n=1 Tax=Streptosporangium TaxID=2000 RepID=UPI003522F3C8
MAAAGLVAWRKSGTRVIYRLADPRVALLAEQVKRLAHDLLPAARQAADAWLGDAAALRPIGRDELARRLADGQAVVVDVRPATEYAAGHISGGPGHPLGPAARAAGRVARGRRGGGLLPGPLQDDGARSRPAGTPAGGAAVPRRRVVTGRRRSPGSSSPCSGQRRSSR